MKLRKKLMSLTLVAALFGGLVAGCAPGPKEVCDHLEKLAKKEFGDKAASRMAKGCVKRWERAKEMKGYFKYRKRARCVVATKKLKDIGKCK